jgi:hypothetical protein
MTPSFHPEPPPQNDLERLLRKAAEDPALHGRMWRMIWESEVFTFIPYPPEIEGEFPLENGDEFTFCTYEDADGKFIAVFASEAAAEWAGEQIPEPKPAIASMPAEALFKIANNGQFSVRVNHGLLASVALTPEGVADLVRGDLRHFQASDSVREKVTLHHVPADEVPSKLRQAIRVFCVQRPLAVGVYAFHPVNRETGEVDDGELRLMLWLREEKGDLYHDFRLMIDKVKPPHLRVTCGGVTPGETAAIEFLQGRTPLWPVV